MSAPSAERPEGETPMSLEPGVRRRLGARRLLTVAWLTLAWMMLWGTFSWANLLSGIVVAIAVLALFPLPYVSGQGRFRPVALVRFVAGVIGQLVVSSLQVAWQSVRPGPPIRSSVIEVTLDSDSEFHMAMLIETLSLVPGSVVLDARPDEQRFYAHVLGVADDAGVERFRRQVARVEARLLAITGGDRR